ncbi:CapA family protein [Aneurinibacillus thermoaerophilus]|uniref:CapA family protein n=1 Tax=Aneurinibacillus thermoaerophilus TaxID=143495 RepID=UPI002E240809|nr:CapA family protein [Aneurinibacillus thermoaerophilus]
MKKLQRTSLFIILSITFFTTLLYAVSAIVMKISKVKETTKIAIKPADLRKPEERRESGAERWTPTEIITVSAAGDVTIGRDEAYPYPFSFEHEVMKNGKAFFGKHIRAIFNRDDLTIVNLETTLTTATAKATKTFRFRGKPEYVQILTLSGIDAVNLANNHTHDYLREGYEDTIKNLQKYHIGYFGYDNKYMKTIKGIKIGLLGYEGWENSEKLQRTIARDIAELRGRGTQIVIVSFHWGVERSYYPNRTQKALGRYAVERGADLVLGHHPHVMQGIEEYKGKFIVYSLGNFVFGGNKNPKDKDTFIFQQTFYVKSGSLTGEQEIRIIPCSISSVKERNNYQPLPLKGVEAERVRARLKAYSRNLGELDWSTIK